MQESYHNYILRKYRELDMKQSEYSRGPSKWDQRFFDMAKLVATWSKDPSRKVGAVAVNDEKRILATGYNGFPRGINDSPERLSDRDEKYPRIIHAEMNVLMNALYNGVSVKDASLYVYGLPICSDCTKAVIQSGIARVFIDYQDDMPENWRDAWNNISKPMFKEAGVEINYVQTTNSVVL